MAFKEYYPKQYEGWLKLKNGHEIFFRPIMPADEALVVDLFRKLSPQSVYRRFLRHLQALPQEMLYKFTHIDYNSEFALVGLINEDARDTIIAIARYAYTPDETLPTLGIAVRDDWQHIGLGKYLLKKIVEIAKKNGIYKFSGMIDPQNKTIMQILAKLGYQVNYVLRDGFFQVEILV